MNNDFENNRSDLSDIPENINNGAEKNDSVRPDSAHEGTSANYVPSTPASEPQPAAQSAASIARSWEQKAAEQQINVSAQPEVAPEYKRETPFGAPAGAAYRPQEPQAQPNRQYQQQGQYTQGAQYAHGGQFAQNANGGYYNHPGNVYGNAYGAPNTSYTPPKKKKKEKRPVSRGFVALAVCFCIVFSGIVGLVGAYIGTELSGASTYAPSGGSVNINYNSDGTGGVISSEATVSSVAEIAADTVVEITTETVSTSQYFGQYVTEGAGSGVIMSEDGYIITCAHVISGATAINVTLRDGSEYTAELIGSDSRTDIAVIKIDADEALVCATFGNSDELVVGQDVIAIGNPLGELGGTVTNGIVSALGREVQIDGQSYTLLQTNAAINPGNSGGGLFDANGNLIGVVNAKSSGDNIEGLGFAIPSNEALEIAEQLIEHGYITNRPQIGVSLIEVKSAEDYMKYWQYRKYFDDYGVYVIESKSDALKLGDRILAVDGTTITSVSDIKSIIEERAVGDEITVTVSRMSSATNRSHIEEVTVTLTEQASES